MEQDLRASIAASLSSARVRCWASGWTDVVTWDVSLFPPSEGSSLSFALAVVGPWGWMISFNEDRLKRTRTKKKPSEKKTRCRLPDQDHRSPNGLHILAFQWEPSAYWWKVIEGDQSKTFEAEQILVPNGSTLCSTPKIVNGCYHYDPRN